MTAALGLQDAVFLAVAALTLSAGFLAVMLRNVFYNALALIVCLFGIACLFIYLGCEFLAVMEVIIYIGAIAVAILFAIMLSRTMLPQAPKRSGWKLARSLVIAGLLWAGLLRVLCSTRWPSSPTDGDYSLRALGKNLLEVNALPFEVVSVILLVAIVGALVVSSREDRR